MTLPKDEESFFQTHLKNIFSDAILKKGGKCLGCQLNQGFETTLPKVAKVLKITSDIVVVKVCCKQYTLPVKPFVGEVCKRQVHVSTKKTCAEWEKVKEQKAVASAHPS